MKLVTKAAAKVKQVAAGGDKKSKNALSKNRKSDEEPVVHTDEILAKAAGVGRSTMSQAVKIAKIAEDDDDAAKIMTAIEAGTKSLGKGYKEVKEIEQKKSGKGSIINKRWIEAQKNPYLEPIKKFLFKSGLASKPGIREVFFTIAHIYTCWAPDVIVKRQKEFKDQFNTLLKEIETIQKDLNKE